MRHPVLAFALIVSGCTASDGVPGDPPETAASAVPVQSSDEILGEWDVVSFEGYEPQQRMEGTVRSTMADFGPDGVRLRIECNWSGTQGNVRDGRFVREQNEGPGMAQTLIVVRRL